jgi:hypothetical protein
VSKDVRHVSQDVRYDCVPCPLVESVLRRGLAECGVSKDVRYDTHSRPIVSL